MPPKVPFHRPSVSERERAYLLEALEGRYWGGGPWVERLEAALQNLYGREAVVVSSGTAALHLAYMLLLGKEGGEVIVPTWTFTATASEVVHAGGVPVVVDVGPSLHLTVEQVEAALSPRTRGVVVMHYAGAPAPVREIVAFCRERGLWVVEDACHAVPAFVEGQLCGTFGDIATLSFHATKPVAAGQGGALLLSDPALAEKARRLRAHGIRRTPAQPWSYEVESLGWNYRLSDFQAAVALAQIEQLTELWQARKRLATLYIERLQNYPWLQPYTLPDFDQGAWHLFPVFWSGATASQRDTLLSRLYAQGFELSVHYKPLHRHKAYQPYLTSGHTFPIAEKAYNEVLSLPLWPGLSEKAILELVALLGKETHPLSSPPA